jgi:hypothetical protein
MKTENHNSHFFKFIRAQETTNDDEIPPVRPKRGIKKRKGKGVSFATDVKFSEEGTSSPGSANKISFDPEAFSCAVQNILGKSVSLTSK